MNALFTTIKRIITLPLKERRGKRLLRIVRNCSLTRSEYEMRKLEGAEYLSSRAHLRLLEGKKGRNLTG